MWTVYTPLLHGSYARPERAAELGGTCTISSRTPNEGLIVHAILPLHDTPHQPADIKAER